jgi:putative transposase
MPRRPRVIVEGAVYHVYNRLARGSLLLGERAEADRFVELLRTARDRDGLAILAWCVMSNHYHLALRTGPVPLGRTMAFIQARFGQRHNLRSGTAGPLWQSRYKAKLVADERYLLRLVAYIHLNPVAARVVRDPARFGMSGHREIVGRTNVDLVDVDATLALFGRTRTTALRGYLRILQKCRKDPWLAAAPGQLPWWQREPDRPLLDATPAAALDPLGRSPGPSRPRLDAAGFIERACALLGADEDRLSDSGKDHERCEVRYLVGGLAIERWRIRAGELAAVIGRRPEVISRWAGRAAQLRGSDPDFAARYEKLDVALAAAKMPRR